MFKRCAMRLDASLFEPSREMAKSDLLFSLLEHNQTGSITDSCFGTTFAGARFDLGKVADSFLSRRVGR